MYLFTLSAIGVISVEISEKKNYSNDYNSVYTPIDSDSLILKAELINDSLRMVNENKALQKKERLQSIKNDSVKKHRTIVKQKSSIKSLEIKNRVLKNENIKLSKEVQKLKAIKETPLIASNDTIKEVNKTGFIKKDYLIKTNRNEFNNKF